MRNRTELDQLRRLNELTQVRLVRADRLLCLGILSSAFLQRQEAKEAFDAAERGLAVLREVDVVWGSYVYGVVGITEVLLARWAEEKDRRDIGSNARSQALLACRHAVRATRMSPVCRPQALLFGRAAPRSCPTGPSRRNACGATPRRRRKNCRCRASSVSRSTKSAGRVARRSGKVVKSCKSR